MANESNKRVQRILIIAAAILFAVILYANRRILGETVHLLSGIKWWYLLALPALQALAYLSTALYYRTFFKTFNINAPFIRMVKMVYALEFVNQILPSGGLSGVTYFVYGMRDKASTGTVSLAQLGRYVFSYLSYFGVFTVALVFLIYGTGDTQTRIYGYLVALVFGAIVGSFALIYLISSRERTDTVIGGIGRFIDWISMRFRKGKPLFGRSTIQESISDFHNAYRRVKKERRYLWRPLLFMALNTFFTSFITIVSFWAIGVHINVGAILFAYAVANAAGVLSVVPGDFGVHEATMIAMLTLAGSPAAAAVSATLLYRIYNKFVFFPFGFYFYSQLLKPMREQGDHAQSAN